MKVIEGQKLYTRAEVADLLGISLTSLYSYCKAAEIVPVRIGRWLYFSDKQIKQIISSRIQHANNRTAQGNSRI